jgi:two-component system nitrate/nitrite sensor histidine kinase NarX
MYEPQSPRNRLLLIGADEKAVGAITALLTARGYLVRALATGERAVEEAQDASADLILLGSNLPSTDTLALLARFRASAGTSALPVVVLSDTAEIEDPSALVAAGATDVLAWSFGEGLFLARLEAALELAALRRKVARRDALLEKETATRRQVEETVRTAELSGRELVENLSEVIYTAEPDGTLTYVSPGIERLLGYTPEELLDRHVSDVVHRSMRAPLAGRMRRVLAGNREANEYRLVTKTGETRWAHTSSQPVFAGEQVIGIQGVLTDITERKQAEERIQQQNDFLTSILESLTHPFYVLNVHDYAIEMANSAARFESLTGDATCYALTHRRDSPCSSTEHPCPIEELKRTGRPVTVEHVHYDSQGAVRFVEVHSYPLFDANGTIVRAIEYTLDITERKQAEYALRESEARWRSVTEHSPDHVILLDAELRIQFLNYPSPGLTIEELIGRPLYTYVREERQSQVKDILEHVLDTGEPASYETSYRTPDGDTIHYESRVVPRTVDDQIVGLAVNARDITEHKHSEQALRALSETTEQARQAERERRREADQRRRVAESLAGVMAALNSNQPLDQVLDHIASQARELLDSEAVTVYSLDEAKGALVPQATQCPVWADRQAIECACNLDPIAQVLASRQPFARNDDLEIVPPNGDSWPEGHFRALLAVPIIVKDQVYGGLIMCSTEPRSYSTEEVELASTFAIQVALAVENARLRKEREQAAAVAERNRLARDLHDSVTQALFSASLVAEVLPQIWERDTALAREGLQELGTLTRGALAEMRTMLLELRPTAVVETKLSDLVWQLAEAVTGRAGLLVTYAVEPSPSLPPDVHVTFYRVAQEALNNVLKHAGAKHVTVSLSAVPPVDPQVKSEWQEQVKLTISDDGRGFDSSDAQADQLGLGIMRERAETIEADLEITSRPGRGTEVTLLWPKARLGIGA